MENLSTTPQQNSLRRCEVILEELGGWDTLVLMTDAKDFHSFNENYVCFFTNLHKVEVIKCKDFFTGEPVYNLRIWKTPEYTRLCNKSGIRAQSGLLARSFEFYTGYSLTF